MDETRDDPVKLKPRTGMVDTLADWIPSSEERFDLTEVAAYHIAERSGFSISPEKCWDTAEEQINLIFALRESRKKLQTLIDTSLDAVVMIDSEGLIIGWNPQASIIFGWTAAEAIGRQIAETIIPERHRDSHLKGLRHFLASGEGPFMNRMVETHALHRDGHEFPVELAIAAMMTEGRPEFSAFIRNITERQRAESELREMATTDFLTGLANRRHFIARMTDELARQRRLDNSHCAVLMLDLDHFKRINDSHGHAIGDAMLRHFATLMRNELRKIDTAGRVGGEEFAILLPGAGKDDARIFAERLRRGVEATPLQIDGKAISVTVSIGIAIMLRSDETPDSAMIRADEALYRAKAGGRNRVEIAL